MVSSSSSSSSPPVRPQDIQIIHEIYDHYNTIGHEQSLQQLDLALEANAPVIIIEPIRLGDETSRWIAVGNFLHKSTVLAGIGALTTCGMFPSRWLIYTPQAILSVGCFAVYTISWHSDPCCKYQVETREEKLAQLPLNGVSAQSPVVLVRRDDTRRKLFHSAVALLTAGFVSFRLWKLLSD